jgi:riboflavin synthase
VFTGLVETTAKVLSISPRSVEAKINLAVQLEDVQLGESISVNGVCLTVAEVRADGFEADVSSETLAVSSLGALRAGSWVNIERSTRLGGRLGGHIVLGHVDGLGTVSRFDRVAAAWRLEIVAPDELQRFLAPKGSVAIDGISLTINRLLAPRAFEVMVVPHTLSETNFQHLRSGMRVNLEVDVLARYVARQLECAKDGNDLEAKLREGGFLA